MNPLETYLEELRAIRSSGAVVKETSGYGALANLLNAIGHTLKPKVRCFINVKNSGAGLPDGGLFTPDQLKNTDEEAPLLGIPLPARGVIEVKATSAEVDDVAATLQVREYVRHYGAVLVTNYRSFLLLKRGDNGKPVCLESFQLAPNEKSFWVVAAQPRKAANELGERFAEYLKRVLLHAAPLNNPKDVAFFLASYARDARVRVEGAKDLPALAAVRGALEEALGMKFEAEKGEHFFRSTLVQTLFYGVFSAWVLWHKEKPQRLDAFDWKSAAWTLHVPMIKALFDQVATPTKLGPLGLVEVLDWTAAVLNRVDRAAFFDKFLETHAVQYFYEPFLEAFDPELRKELGVWYTPPEIVQYQVARADAALREELDIADGLADPRVFVLDPCCGTGAYLVEVLRKIENTLKEKGEGDALNAEAIKEAAQKRVFGFEIMPAPFVVAHLQMGLLLQNLAAPLDDTKNERAGIFLTNALTGWDFAGGNPKLANWPELEYEKAEPRPNNRFSFRPSDVSSNYLEWPKIPDFAAIPSFNGPVERRAMALISINKQPLVTRLASYFDEKVTNEQVAQIYPSLMMTGNRIVGPEARKKVLSEFSFDESRIVRYPFKPYDIRWCYLENLRPLFSEPSPQLLEQRFKGNNFFITRDTADKDIEGSPFYFSPLVCDYDCISGHARHFPIRLRATPKTKAKKKDDGNGEFGNILHEAAPAYNAGKITANLSPAARAYLAKLDIKDPDDDADTAALIWMHALAIGYSPAYLAENADGVRQDWPRIPLPDAKATLIASAELGKQLAALLDTETPVKGVTAGTVRPELVKIAVVTRLTRETLNLSVTAGWGHAGKEGVTMPGKGKLATRILDVGPDYKLPWFEFHDVYLNESACWKDIPAEVWDYTIGGYQVIKKWLSYREFALLGRALTPDEAREVTHMARRIAALILLQPKLDQNYQFIKAATVSL